jgi:pimeloyl-ACP methyl ester carboxylesterase
LFRSGTVPLWAVAVPPAQLWLASVDVGKWIAAYFADKGVRRDLRRLTAALGDDDFMNRIAAELAAFTRPALLAWAADDKFFPAGHARRLAAILPDARVELIADSRTWVMLDQPERTAHLITELARRATAQQAA